MGSPATHRCEAIAADSVGAIERRLADMRALPRHYRARREILPSGRRLSGMAIVVKGWVCRHRLLQDGRRQITGLILPGELIHDDPAHTGDGLSAIDDVTLIDAPAAGSDGDPIALTYARSAVLDRGYLIDHIVRLGRQAAYERMAHLLLELYDRLRLAGTVDRPHFQLPLTQETLADLLGLTSVHVNRTLQALRRNGLVTVHRGAVELLDEHALRRIADYRLLSPTADGGWRRSDGRYRAAA